MSTKKIYPCCNYSIVAAISYDASDINIDLINIHKPDVCLTAIGSATYRNQLRLNPGTHRLVFQNRTASDQYDLIVTDTFFRIQGPPGELADTVDELIWRYPPRSFACQCGTTTDLAWMCEAFVDSLLSIPSLQEFAFPDSGRTPYPTTDARYFECGSESDFEAAVAVLERFSRNIIDGQEGVHITLMNWRNRRVHSWLVD
ncbi:MAG: hypothetical protein ABIF77_05995 [bacterium]